MPLAAHSPADRVEQLIILTERLTDLMQKETHLLEEHRPQEIPAFQDERAKLSTLYAQEMTLIKENTSLIAGVDPQLSTRLKELTVAFQETLEKHGEILKRVQSVTEGMVKAVADDVQQKNQSQTHYGHDGTLKIHQNSKGSSLSVHTVV